VAESSPRTARQEIGVETVKARVEEAQVLEFEHIYFTGGEPFLLDSIYEMLTFASSRLPTTILTNAMLLQRKRLERLAEIRTDNLTIQVSLDGGSPAPHDAYRGAGSWARTVDGLKNLVSAGFRVRLATTETPANTAHLQELCALRQSLGISEDDHIIRPLARRGFSKAGLEVSKTNLAPEITLNNDGFYWHPLSTDPDMRVLNSDRSLSEVVEKIQAELVGSPQDANSSHQTFQ
jgi:MoaA/NifB/PqqE/SkfB family radical SAM enzyme